jgi:hypothetical protein
MATGVIAQYKIDSIATHLVAPQGKKIEELLKTAGEEYTERALSALPTMVRDTFSEFPECMAHRTSVYFYGTTKKESVCIRVDVPDLDLRKDIELSAEDKVFMGNLIDEILHLRQSKGVLYGKSVCAIEKIKTYKRLQVEFPEAYKILIEKVDKGDVKSDTLCDTVESLRAELGVTEKPIEVKKPKK